MPRRPKVPPIDELAMAMALHPQPWRHPDNEPSPGEGALQGLPPLLQRELEAYRARSGVSASKLGRSVNLQSRQSQIRGSKSGDMQRRQPRAAPRANASASGAHTARA
eukprot:TRINITY_DN33652_c0_g1_i1.p1 TRINITY_DN33652_c0_g1~~TRINITY_DN33652_c0_g1_i1.p1  ORF type:complete len:108 (+),score=14.04 TRINITY_DN33652_c0_g1_i1:95-418(+)